jgi:hypothetical protein
MRAERLLAAGAMMATRPLRHVALGERLILSGFAVGGVAGLSWHILAPALVAAGKVIVEWAVPG